MTGSDLVSGAASGVAAPETGNRRGRDTRRRILAAAEMVFEERGLSLTLDEVARASTTTRMTVHRHTGGREALITHLVLRASAALGDDLRTILDAEGPIERRLADALVHAVVAIRAEPHLASLFTGTDLSGTWPTLDPDHRVVDAIERFFGPYLEPEQTDGRLRADPDTSLAWMLHLLLSLLVIPQNAPDPGDVRRWVDGFVIPSLFRDRP